MHWGLMEKSRTMNHDFDGNVCWEEVDGRYRERRGQSTVSHSRIKAKEFQTKLQLPVVSTMAATGRSWGREQESRESDQRP